MLDFNINKVGFALALLGVFFAMYPIIQDVGDAGFYFTGAFLSIRLFYYLTLASLGMGIYFYAIDFISPGRFNYARKFGNVFYALGFVFPDLYVILWVTSLVAGLMKFLEAHSPVLYLIAYMVGGFIDLVVIVLVIRYIIRRLNRSDTNSRIKKLSGEQFTHMNRARGLLDWGYYAEAVAESCEAVSSGFEAMVIEKGLKIEGADLGDYAPAGVSAGIVPDSELDKLERLRAIKDAAAKDSDSIDEAAAREALDISDGILKAISSNMC